MVVPMVVQHNLVIVRVQLHYTATFVSVLLKWVNSYDSRVI